MHALAVAALVFLGQLEAVSVSESERARMQKLLDHLSEIMRTGRHEDVEPLLSPGLSREERDELRRLLRSDLSKYEYRSFDFTVLDVEGRVREGESFSAWAAASYEYATRGSGPGATADRGENSWLFNFDVVDGKWYLGKGDFFLTLSEHSPASIFSTMFFVATLALAFVVFWLWTAADCFFRTRSATRALLVLLTPPVGPLYYAVTAWVRRKEEE